MVPLLHSSGFLSHSSHLTKLTAPHRKVTATCVSPPASRLPLSHSLECSLRLYAVACHCGHVTVLDTREAVCSPHSPHLISRCLSCISPLLSLLSCARPTSPSRRTRTRRTWRSGFSGCPSLRWQPGNQATEQPGNQATRQPGNQATRQPGNQATRRPGGHQPAGRPAGDPVGPTPGARSS